MSATTIIVIALLALCVLLHFMGGHGHGISGRHGGHASRGRDGEEADDRSVHSEGHRHC
ncbi:MAG: DUF2933 domain-containing protein [Gemmatimonadetes bacterium]|nr:DUF2933 domain-containing protein [Gemmatimonadota bacterium]